MRIASLLPSATEIVCAIGLEDDLVAVTHECDFPPSVRNKPVVTRSLLAEGRSSGQIDRHIRQLVHEGSSIYALDADRLRALEPDLILNAGALRRLCGFVSHGGARGAAPGRADQAGVARA